MDEATAEQRPGLRHVGLRESRQHGDLDHAVQWPDADAYTGMIKAAAHGMNMTIKLTGKKIGSCDNPM
jgi:hypothetical protein